MNYRKLSWECNCKKDLGGSLKVHFSLGALENSCLHDATPGKLPLS